MKKKVLAFAALAAIAVGAFAKGKGELPEFNLQEILEKEQKEKKAAYDKQMAQFDDMAKSSEQLKSILGTADSSVNEKKVNYGNPVVLGTQGLDSWGKPVAFSKFYLKIINKTNENDIPLDFFCMKRLGQNWQRAGSAFLLNPCEHVQTEADQNLYECNFWAVVPTNGKSYKITVSDDLFWYFGYGKFFLIISVEPLDPQADMSYKKGAAIIKTSDITSGKKFDGNFRIYNKTGDKDFYVCFYGFSESYSLGKPKSKKMRARIYGKDEELTPIQKSQRISIYGMNVETEAWNAIGAEKVNDNPEKYVEPDFHPRFYSDCYGLPIYEYFALTFSNGKKYKVKANFGSSDIYIELTQ